MKPGHPPSPTSFTRPGMPENIVEETGNHFNGLEDEDIRQELEALARKSEGNILLSDMPRAPGKEVSPAER